MTRPISNQTIIRLVKLDNLKRQLKRAQDDLRERQVQAKLSEQDYSWAIARLRRLVERLNANIENLS